MTNVVVPTLVGVEPQKQQKSQKESRKMNQKMNFFELTHKNFILKLSISSNS